MSFVHGSKTRVYTNGRDVTGYFKSATISSAIDTAEATTFGKTAKVYKSGQEDATLSMDGLWDGPVDNQDGSLDEFLNAMFGTPGNLFCLLPGGDGVGNIAYGFQAIKTSWEIDEPTDDIGQVTIEAQAEKASRQRLEVLHALGSEAAAGDGTPLDNTESTDGGGVGYLHVTGMIGSALDVIIQHSADGVTWADLMTFASVTEAGTALRMEVAGTVEAQVRAKWTPTGGAATFFVAFGRL